MQEAVNAVQYDHAQTMVAVVQARRLPFAAAVIVLMTGITESGLRVLANPSDPVSLAQPNDGTGYDHDSSGIFQQRPGWGSIQARMNPATSTGLFLTEMLRKVPNWTDQSPWRTAQDVQVSAYDGTARAANNFDGEYGGNYRRNCATATSLASRLWLGGGLVSNAHSTMEDPMIIIAAPKKGIAQLVPGGKYHLDGNEWAVISSIRAAFPAAVVYKPVSAAQWDVLHEKRGKL